MNLKFKTLENKYQNGLWLTFIFFFNSFSAKIIYKNNLISEVILFVKTLNFT